MAGSRSKLSGPVQLESPHLARGAQAEYVSQYNRFKNKKKKTSYGLSDRGQKAKDIVDEG